MKKTVLVTGASGDIGLAIARKFLDNNYIVIGTYYKNDSALSNLSEDFPENFVPLKCNLADFSESENLIRQITEFGYSIDILINNAGISSVGLLQDITRQQWDLLWNTNVTSAIALSKYIIPTFLRNGKGKIINISSVWGNVGASCEVCYSATKGALNSFTKALAKELGPSNIEVNAIACGIIDTKMNSHLSKEDLDNISEDIPRGRLGIPEDIAKVSFYLADSSTYMTGQILTIDGGWQM